MQANARRIRSGLFGIRIVLGIRNVIDDLCETPVPAPSECVTRKDARVHALHASRCSRASLRSACPPPASALGSGRQLSGAARAGGRASDDARSAADARRTSLHASGTEFVPPSEVPRLLIAGRRARRPDGRQAGWLLVCRAASGASDSYPILHLCIRAGDDAGDLAALNWSPRPLPPTLPHSLSPLPSELFSPPGCQPRTGRSPAGRHIRNEEACRASGRLRVRVRSGSDRQPIPCM